MYRFVLTSICLATALPVFAGDQSLYPHVHTDTQIVGSFTNPINYRPHSAAGDHHRRGFVEAEIVRSPGYVAANNKYVPRSRSGAWSSAAHGPVTEIFVENLPALNGTYTTR